MIPFILMLIACGFTYGATLYCLATVIVTPKFWAMWLTLIVGGFSFCAASIYLYTLPLP